jgi:hypothetical protein
MRNCHPLSIEPLESKLLLSAFSRPGAARPPALVVVPEHTRPIQLMAGAVTGGFTVVPAVPGTTLFTFVASGRVAPLGRVALSATTGGISTASVVQGNYTLQAAHGGITVALSSPANTPNSLTSPTPLHYKLVAGNGSLLKLHGSGTVVVQVVPNPSSGGTVGSVSFTFLRNRPA